MVKESGFYSKWIENEMKLMGKYYQQFVQADYEEKFSYNQIIISKIIDEFYMFLHGTLVSSVTFILESCLFFLANACRFNIVKLTS